MGKTAKEMRKKYYTEKGEEALTNRFNTLVKLYSKGIIYPFIETKLMGFVPLKIQSKLHHEAMIAELSQLLGLERITMEVKN